MDIELRPLIFRTEQYLLSFTDKLLKVWSGTSFNEIASFCAEDNLSCATEVNGTIALGDASGVTHFFVIGDYKKAKVIYAKQFANVVTLADDRRGKIEMVI